MIRFIDNWGKEYRVEQEEFKNFSDEMAKNGRRFARIQTLVNPKTGEEWEGADWDDAAKDGLQPWEQRSIDDAKEAFKSRIAEGWQHKQREDESNIVTDTLKELNKGENWVDPDGEQSAAEYHAKNIAAGVGSAAVAGVTGLADAIQGTVLNAAAFTSRALGAEDAADTIADVRKDASDNIRAMREKATDAIIEGLDAKGMKDARDLVDTGLDVVEGFSGLYALGGVVGGATKGVVKVAGSIGRTVDAAKVGSTVLAGQMAADAYEHALDELEMQEGAAGSKAISTMRKQIVAGARAAMSAATSRLFGKIAGIGIPKETTQKVIEQSLGRSARVLAQEMGEFALINDLNVLADEAGRLTAGVDRLDPEKGFWSRILDESLHGAGMVLGMKSQKILKGGWNAMMPMRAESFTKSMEAMKRAELGAIDAAGGLRVVATTPNGTGVLNTGGIVRAADGEVVTPDGCVITQDGKLRTVGAGRCGELEGGEYGIKPDAPKDGRRFGEDLTENACELVALAEEGLVETRKVQLEGLGGEPKAGENGIHLRANKDGTLELASDMPENERRKPVVALEHADGTIELVTGRKRVEAAKTSGEGEIDAIVIREKDGWTAESAKVIDIVDNLMKGSPVTDAEAVSAANALGIGYERAVGWGLAQNGNVAAAFRLRENATAGLMNAVELGHLSLETADAIARNANRRNMPGAVDDIQIADIQLELAEKLKGRSAEEVDAVCRKLRERDMDAGEAADQAIRAKVLDEAIAAAERERLEEAAKKSGLTPEQEAKIDNTPMEREDGTLTTVREAELAERRLAEHSGLAEHSSAITTEGERTALRVREDGVITSARFPEVEIVRSEEGGTAILGLKAEEMLKCENREAVTDLLEEVGRSVGAVEIQGAAEVAAAEELLKARVAKRKLQAEETRRNSIKEVLDVLAGSGLAKAVHTDRESFDARLKQGKGIEQWLTDTDEVWGFTDGNEIWLNPKTARLETPIHEYGHLGISMCKKVNREVYDRGIALAKEIGLFKEISENEAYKNSSEESRAEEVLATIIGKRGEEALKGAPETLRAKVKEWLVDFWKAFGEALGLKDITPEQAAKMTLEEVADAIRAEMMSGKRFGEKAESGQAERSSAINTGGMRFSLEMKKQKGNPAVKEVAARIKGLLTGKIARTDSTIAYKESETDNRRLGTEAAKIYERYGNKEYKLPTGGVLYFAPDIRTVNAYNGDVAAAWGEYALHLITHTRGSGENRFRSFDGRNVDVILPMIENIIKENKVTQSDGRIIFFKQTRKAESKSKSRYAYIVTEPDDAGNLRVDLRYITGVEGRGFLPGKTATLEEVIPNRTAEGRALHQNHKSGRIPGQLTTLRDALPTGHAKGIAAAAERTREEEAVINLYSDREGGNPGHKASPGVKTTSSTPQIVSQEGGGKQEGLKYSIGGIFTGSAADYANRSREGGKDDGPSLLKIDSGEGSQVYGWGLYGSTVRGVSEGYAKRGRGAGGKDWIKEGKNRDELSDVEIGAASYIKGAGSKDAAIQKLRENIEWFKEQGVKDEIQALKTILKELQSNGDKYREQHENVYEQTFFTDRAPGDESHLLKWYEPVSEEQSGWIDKAWRKENPKVTSQEALEKLYARLLDGADGQHVYGWLSEVLGSPKAASEFLARAGIDGVKYPVDSYGGKTVKDGDEAGWNYVSFRDDNIRVDHKWTDGELKFSVKINKNLHSEVENALAKGEGKTQMKRKGEVVFSDNLPFFGRIGLPDLRVVSDASHVRKLQQKHHLTGEMIEKLPEHYNNPVAVFKDKPNAYVVITDMMAKTDDGKSKPVMVRLHQKQGKNGEYIFIASAYPRESVQEKEYIRLANTPGCAVFIDENKVAALGLEEGTTSTLRTLKSRDNVITPEGLMSRIVSQNGSGKQEAENNREVMMQVRRQELPTADGEDVAAWLLNGRLRLADDAKYGLAERSSAISTPIEVMTPSGDLKVMKPVEFAFSSLVELYQWMRGSPALPKILTKAHQEKRAWLGRITKGSEVELNPEMFGIVSKSDEVRIKAELKAEGRFRNEDPTWNLRHSKKQNDYEKMLSENLLEDRLRSLAEDRVKGKAGGEYAAPAAALAHEVAALAMEMPANAKMPEIARALRTLGNGIVKIFEKDAAYIDKWKKSGFKVTEAEGSDSMLAEALQAVAWWRGYEGGVRQARDGRGKLYEYKTAEDYFKNNHKELCAEVMGMFLTAPEELSNRALRLYYEIVERLAGDQKLLDAYNRLTEGYSGEGPAEHVMRTVEKQWTGKAQLDIAQLKKELKSSQLGGLEKGWVNARILFGSQEGVAMHFVVKKLNEDKRLAKEALKIAKKSGDKEEIRLATANLKEVEAYRDGVVLRMQDAVLVKHRGGTKDRMYLNEYDTKVRGALKRDGISEEQFDRYLFCQNVIVAEGRAMPFGISPSQAQQILDGLKGALGDMKWRQLEATAKMFHAIRERNVLNDPYVQEMVGKERIDRWKRNVHYVRTERTLSVDEVAMMNGNAENAREMERGVLENFETLIRLHEKKGAGSGDRYLKPLVGSLNASERPSKATLLHDSNMKEYARMNHYICHLAEVASELQLPGFKVVRDMSYRSVDGGERYGTLSYMKDGENYLLIVPKEIMKAMEKEPEQLKWLFSFTRGCAKLMTTYSLRFAERNIIRNRETNEANIEWMQPSLLKRGMGKVGMRGLANFIELVVERFMVRAPDALVRNVLTRQIWGPKTNMYSMSEATRVAKLILIPGEWRRVAERADALVQEAMEKGGDLKKAQAASAMLLKDMATAREAQKYPMLSDSFQKVSGLGKGAKEIDRMFRELEGRADESELKNLPFLRRIWEKTWSGIKWYGEKVEDLNTVEEARTKLAAWLSARTQKEMLMAKGKKWKYGDEKEVARIVATSAGAPMGELRGTAMGCVENLLTGPFVNVAMRGVQRTVASANRAPVEWATKATERAFDRAMQITMFSGGGIIAMCTAARYLFDDNEDALKVIDWVEDWGRKTSKAYSMITDYRIKNYDVLPIAMVGEDSVIAIGMPRGDEDRMLTPLVDYITQQMLGSEWAKKWHLSETMSGLYGLDDAIARTILDSGIAPDLTRGGIVNKLFDDFIKPLQGENPHNWFTGRPVYEKNLFDTRWERKKDFAWEVLKQEWNNMGGNAIWQAPVGPESKTSRKVIEPVEDGKQPKKAKMRTLFSVVDGKEYEIPYGESVFDAIRKTPLASAVMSGFVFMNENGEERVARKVEAMGKEFEAICKAIALNCVDHKQKTKGEGSIGKIIEDGIKKYGLDEDCFSIIENIFKNMEKRLARATKRETISLKKLHKGMSDSEYQRKKRALLIGASWSPEE